MAFNHKYNNADTIIRGCIVGLVNEMNNRIHYQNVWEDTDSRLVRVPFFYAMSGDERFLQDYFSNWSDCAPDFIEGNYDIVPRGTIFLTGVSVLGSNLTSRFVRGYYHKEQEGELKRFNSYINSIPLQLNFSAEILVDTSIDSFKITESIIAVFYKTLVYNVAFKGFRVPTQAGFPEGYDLGKQFEFTYGVTERQKITFDVEVQTYLPLTDVKEEFFAGKTIQGTSVNYDVSTPAVKSGTNAGTNTGAGAGAGAGAEGNTLKGPESCRTSSDSITPGATFTPSQDEQNYTNPSDEP
jgi:hypothetical protein